MKAEPRPRHLGWREPLEGLEDPLALLGGYPGPGIADGDPDPSFGRLDAELDCPASVKERVVDEVGKYLPQASGVRGGGREPVGDAHADASARRRGAGCLRDLLRDRTGVAGSDHEVEAVGVEARRGEEVVGQPPELVGGSGDDIEQSLARLRLERRFPP